MNQLKIYKFHFSSHFKSNAIKIALGIWTDQSKIIIRFYLLMFIYYLINRLNG